MKGFTLRLYAKRKAGGRGQSVKTIIQDKTKIHEYVKLQEDSLKRSCALQPHKAGSDGLMASGQLLQSLAATVSHKRLLSQKTFVG